MLEWRSSFTVTEDRNTLNVIAAVYRSQQGRSSSMAAEDRSLTRRESVAPRRRVTIVFYSDQGSQRHLAKQVMLRGTRLEVAPCGDRGSLTGADGVTAYKGIAGVKNGYTTHAGNTFTGV
ncbi:hypothetical protein AB0E15_21605, partial [Streptomyces sp. NPDC047939]